MILKLGAIGAILLAVSNSGAAQNNIDTSGNPGILPQRKETVIVTGTYQPTPLQNSDRSVDVIDFSDSRILYGNWVDGLRSDSSVDLRQRAAGLQADLSIRGSSFGQALVLVDGLRVNDAQSAHHNLDLPVPFSSVDRIEVLHGSGSTMYGSDAVGGAVNFITGVPTSTALTLGAAGGNFGTNRQNGSLSYSEKRFSEALSFTRDFSSGFMPDRDYRNLALASESHFASRLGSTAILLGQSDRPFGANQFYGDFDSWERTKGWFAGASQELGNRTQAAFGYRRHTDEFILFREQPSIYENNHVTESYQLALRRHDPIGHGLVLFYGAEGYRDTIDSNNLGYHARNRGAFYGDLNRAGHGRTSFSVGARVENYSGGETEFSPQVAFGFRISDSVRVKASASHAFRLPTFTDLYYSDPANLGNPNLKPEKAWSYEGGIVWKVRDSISTEMTLFARRERNGIDYVRSSPAVPWQAANIDRLNFTGVEVLSTIARGQRQSFQLGYTGIYGAQESTAVLVSKYVRDYPVHQATAGWLGSMHNLRLRGRIGVTDRYKRGAYPLAEVSAVRSFRFVSPYLQITNLLNTGYEEIDGVRMPGRAYVAGLELHLSRETRTP